MISAGRSYIIIALEAAKAQNHFDSLSDYNGLIINLIPTLISIGRYIYDV